MIISARLDQSFCSEASHVEHFAFDNSLSISFQRSCGQGQGSPRKTLCISIRILYIYIIQIYTVYSMCVSAWTQRHPDFQNLCYLVFNPTPRKPNFNGCHQTRHPCALRKVSFQLHWVCQSHSDWALGRRFGSEHSGYPALTGNGLHSDRNLKKHPISLEGLVQGCQSETVRYGQVLASTAHTWQKDCMFSWIYSIILNHTESILYDIVVFIEFYRYWLCPMLRHHHLIFNAWNGRATKYCQ